jgi:Fe-S-cluster containining protein
MKKNGKEIVINGIRVDKSVFRKVALRPCGPDCLADCCSGGVWMTDDEPPRIMKWAKTIKRHLPKDRHDEAQWFVTRKSKDTPSGIETGTNTVEDPAREDETCCIFLRTDRKCALQVISRDRKLGWPGIKPFYCSIYPLYLENDVFSIDETTELDEETALCRHKADEKRPMFEIYRDEAILILGKKGYGELKRIAAGTNGTRATSQIAAKAPAAKKQTSKGAKETGRKATEKKVVAKAASAKKAASTKAAAGSTPARKAQKTAGKKTPARKAPTKRK